MDMVTTKLDTSMGGTGGGEGCEGESPLSSPSVVTKSAAGAGDAASDDMRRR